VGSASLRMDLPAGDAGRLVSAALLRDSVFRLRPSAITVDGVLISTVEVRRGEVTVTLPLPAPTRPRHVVLEFADGQDLPTPEKRRMGMLVREIAIR
jgi:hypothetical protein